MFFSTQGQHPNWDGEGGVSRRVTSEGEEGWGWLSQVYAE